MSENATPMPADSVAADEQTPGEPQATNEEPTGAEEQPTGEEPSASEEPSSSEEPVVEDTQTYYGQI